MKEKIKIILLGILVLLIALSNLGEDKPDELIEKKISLNTSLYWLHRRYPDYGSRDYRGSLEAILKDSFEKLTENIEKKPAIIAGDKLDIPKCVRPNKEDITFAFMYEIKDNFMYLNAIFKINQDMYFLLEDSVIREKDKFNGIYRINDDKWYGLITGTKFDFAVDLGKNRMLGYYIKKPMSLFGFNQSFANEFEAELPDFRFRKELHKLSDKKFLFHNFRLTPEDYAVEIYSIDGTRNMECFNLSPAEFKQDHPYPIAQQTVLTTDHRGHFYIAFQYPMNPYRIWKYDENGNKLSVLGNYFAPPDVYDSSEEWIRMKFKDIDYYGLNQVYAIDKLLIDSVGRLLVFFSKNSIKRKHRGEDVTNYYIDVYSKEGEFIGRGEFKYGIPQAVDKDIIYSRMKESRKTWKIAVSRMIID